MKRRVLCVVAAATLALATLAGCSSAGAGASSRGAAEKSTTEWIEDAASAVASPPPGTQTKTSSFENCRNDHGFFVTTSEWRTVAELAVPASAQSSARGAIETAFRDRGWTARTGGGILTLTGPKAARGLIRVESGGATRLIVSAISACYKS